MQYKLDSTNLEVLAEGELRHQSNLLLRKTSQICGKTNVICLQSALSKFQNQRLNHLFMRK